MRRRDGLLVGLLVLGGCLLRTPDPPRFFRPGSAALEAAAEDQADPPAAGGIAIRLRGVRSEPFLRERIVWRVSEVEYGLYEQRRWIDLPAHYVEQALGRRLRETPGLRLTNDPQAVALRVDGDGDGAGARRRRRAGGRRGEAQPSGSPGELPRVAICATANGVCGGPWPTGSYW